MLKVRTQKLGEVVVLCLQGQLVAGETDTLRRAVAVVLHASALALDFARVSRIDAHGLGVLLDLRQQLQSKGIEFKLMNVTRLVRQVLAITKLDTVFEFTSESEVGTPRDRSMRAKLMLAPSD